LWKVALCAHCRPHVARSPASVSTCPTSHRVSACAT
jgi:hypothetical protein